MTPLTVLRLCSTDLMLIERQLRVKIAEKPQIFLHAPVMLDFAGLEQPEALSIPALVSLMKHFKLVPVAGINVPQAMRATVTGSGLGLLPVGRTRGLPEGETGLPEDQVTPPVEVIHSPLERNVAPPPPPPPAAERRPPPPAPPPVVRTPFGGPVVVTQPVRGGQVVYAQNNDLIVMAPVNPGAQVIADGHVHIYAPMRGRAVAGAQGLPGARLFIQKLEAELVAISGVYLMAEEIPPQHRGRPVQVYLEDGQCRILPL